MHPFHLKLHPKSLLLLLLLLLPPLSGCSALASPSAVCSFALRGVYEKGRPKEELKLCADYYLHLSLKMQDLIKANVKLKVNMCDSSVAMPKHLRYLMKTSQGPFQEQQTVFRTLLSVDAKNMSHFAAFLRSSQKYIL